MRYNRWGWNVRGSGSGSTTGHVEQLCSVIETAGCSYFVAYIDLFICKHFTKSLLFVVCYEPNSSCGESHLLVCA
jgi:hypothetical protein